MYQPEAQLVEASTGRPDRTRRYSPFDRAVGLRRVPDEPIGLAFFSSLALHALLILAVVRLTDAPPEIPGADVSSILVDVAASAPPAAPVPAGSRREAAPVRPPVAPRPAATTPSAPASAPRHPAQEARTPTPVPPPAPAVAAASPAPTAGGAPHEDPAALAGTPSPAPIPAPAPAGEAVALVSAPSAAPASSPGPPVVTTGAIPDVALDAGWQEPLPRPGNSTIAAAPAPPQVPTPAPRAQDPEGPTTVAARSVPSATRAEPPAAPVAVPDVALDAGWQSPPPLALASTMSATPAKALTPVPLLRAPTPEPPVTVARGPAPVEATPPTSAPIAPPLATPTVIPGATATEEPMVAPPSPEPPTRAVEPAPLPVPEPTPAAAVPAARPTAPGRVVLDAPAPQNPSPFGLSLGHALVQLDGPRARVTDQPAPRISGRILGSAPERLVLYVNGAPTEVQLARRTFEASVALQQGANQLRAVVTGPDGREAEDTITIQYTPPAASGPIVLTSPPDGLTLGPDDPPVVVVEGETGDPAPASVWIVANDRRVPVTTRGGRFRHVLLLSDPLVRLWAEAPDGDHLRRSEPVTIRTATTPARAGALVMQWPPGVQGSSVEVSATWRAHPERLDGPVQTVRLPGAAPTGDGSPSDIFVLRGLRPGVYTLIVRYRGGAPLGDARPTLYLPDKDRLTSRPLRPVPLSGGGRKVLTRILMPQAVLWDQDDWFSGRSESVDTVTKFRIPDGVSWVERKGDLP